MPSAPGMPPSAAAAATPMSARSVDAPSLNARQRKQVFMHSEIFEADGPTPHSLYGPQRQSAVYEQIARVSSDMSARRRAEVAMPSPADLKVTANAGHGVVQPGRPHSAASPTPAAVLPPFAATATAAA